MKVSLVLLAVLALSGCAYDRKIANLQIDMEAWRNSQQMENEQLHKRMDFLTDQVTKLEPAMVTSPE